MEQVLCVGAGLPCVFFLRLPDQMREAQRAAGRAAVDNPMEAKGAVREAPPPAPPAAPVPPPLSHGALLRDPRLWALWLGLVGAYAPGFGVKMIISPLMEAVFFASDTTQQAPRAQTQTSALSHRVHIRLSGHC